MQNVIYQRNTEPAGKKYEYPCSAVVTNEINGYAFWIEDHHGELSSPTWFSRREDALEHAVIYVIGMRELAKKTAETE